MLEYKYRHCGRVQELECNARIIKRVEGTMIGYLNFKLPYNIKKKRNYYVVNCPLIDVWSQGETERKAVANLKEAISLFIFSCLERETLDKVFRACGATVSKVMAPQQTKGKRYINIPFSLPVKKDPPGKECRV